MFCKFCNKEINDDSAFCSYCGARIERTEETPQQDVSLEERNKPDIPQQENPIKEQTAETVPQEKSSGKKISTSDKVILAIIAAVVVVCLAIFLSGIADCGNDYDSGSDYGSNYDDDYTSGTVSEYLDFL